MYRNCIFCSADLGSNESIEQFPVGRSLAFDGARGRLWAVCPKCARWNLAPIEERWEAIESSERLFRDTRQRVQSENVGLAKLRDGTRLVRVGAALPGELAAWRYGETLMRRRRRYLLAAGGLGVAGAGIVVAGAVLTTVSFTVLWNSRYLVTGLWHLMDGNRRVYHAPAREAARQPVQIRRRHLKKAQLAAGDAGLELRIPDLALSTRPGAARLRTVSARPLVLQGQDARTAIGRAMAAMNRNGGKQDELKYAIASLERARSPEDLLMQMGRRGTLLTGALPGESRQRWIDRDDSRPAEPEPNRVATLALEMALHEETERRAMEGELAMLEQMWRDAEQVASIADRLPDDLPPAEPPRLTPG